MAGIKRALISVSDKTGVVEMAKGLAALGAEVLSTGGTAKALREAGVTVTDVAAYTGSPEILDGRVKTLHPKIHGGLLGRRSVPAHVQQMEQHGIEPIDVVVVNLYPFAAAAERPGHVRGGQRGVGVPERLGEPAGIASAAGGTAGRRVLVGPAGDLSPQRGASDHPPERDSGALFLIQPS